MIFSCVDVSALVFGVDAAEVRRRNEAVRRTSRERFSSLATPSRHGAAAATATMSARRHARARSGAVLAGTTPAAAFGRRSGVTGGLGAVGEAAEAVSESWTARAPRPPGSNRQAGSQSARAGRRAAAAPVGGGPGLMAGVEAAAALRALASDQLAQIAADEAGGGSGPTVDAAEARLIEIRERCIPIAT